MNVWVAVKRLFFCFVLFCRPFLFRDVTAPVGAVTSPNSGVLPVLETVPSCVFASLFVHSLNQQLIGRPHIYSQVFFILERKTQFNRLSIRVSVRLSATDLLEETMPRGEVRFQHAACPSAGHEVITQ